MSTQMMARPRDAQGRFVPHRIGADGLVACGICGQRKLPTSFPTTPRGHPYSYCRRCHAARVQRQQKRRAARDPAWYDARLRQAMVNARRLRQRVGQERLQLAQGAIAWMASRGFWQKEIAALVGCTPDTVRHWAEGRFGAMGHPSVGERLIGLHQVTSDIPAWTGRNRLRDKHHPWLPIVAARLEALRAAHA